MRIDSGRGKDRRQGASQEGRKSSVKIQMRDNDGLDGSRSGKTLETFKKWSQQDLQTDWIRGVREREKDNSKDFSLSNWKIEVASN